jgi:hypothetical protein
MIASFEFGVQGLRLFGFLLKPVRMRYQRVGAFSSYFDLLRGVEMPRPVLCDESGLRPVELDDADKLRIFCPSRKIGDLPNAVERVVVLE